MELSKKRVSCWLTLHSGSEQRKCKEEVNVFYDLGSLRRQTQLFSVFYCYSGQPYSGLLKVTGADHNSHMCKIIKLNLVPWKYQRGKKKAFILHFPYKLHLKYEGKEKVKVKLIGRKLVYLCSYASIIKWKNKIKGYPIIIRGPI
jgi:hypothetical protein